MDSILRLLNLVFDKLRSDPTILGASIGFLAVTSYFCLVRSLRWRRYNNIHKKYEKKWREGGLTPAEAQEILLVSSFWDCPLLLHKAVAFALFKTYAIVSIISLFWASVFSTLVVVRLVLMQILLFISHPFPSYFCPPRN
jgi:hypothetical protein